MGEWVRYVGDAFIGVHIAFIIVRDRSPHDDDVHFHHRFEVENV